MKIKKGKKQNLQKLLHMVYTTDYMYYILMAHIYISIPGLLDMCMSNQLQSVLIVVKYGI